MGERFHVRALCLVLSVARIEWPQFRIEPPQPIEIRQMGGAKSMSFIAIPGFEGFQRTSAYEPHGCGCFPNDTGSMRDSS